MSPAATLRFLSEVHAAPASKSERFNQKHIGAGLQVLESYTSDMCCVLADLDKCQTYEQDIAELTIYHPATRLVLMTRSVADNALPVAAAARKNIQLITTERRKHASVEQIGRIAVVTFLNRLMPIGVSGAALLQITESHTRPTAQSLHGSLTQIAENFYLAETIYQQMVEPSDPTPVHNIVCLYNASRGPDPTDYILPAGKFPTGAASLAALFSYRVEKIADRPDIPP